MVKLKQWTNGTRTASLRIILLLTYSTSTVLYSLFTINQLIASMGAGNVDLEVTLWFIAFVLPELSHGTNSNNIIQSFATVTEHERKLPAVVAIWTVIARLHNLPDTALHHCPPKLYHKLRMVVEGIHHCASAVPFLATLVSAFSHPLRRRLCV
jgi:hypothetical protein